MKPGGGLWGGEKKKNNLGGNWFVLFIVSKRVDSVFPGDSDVTYVFHKLDIKFFLYLLFLVIK